MSLHSKIIPGVRFQGVTADLWENGAMALDENGKIWTWGVGRRGQYGFISGFSPIDIWPPQIIFPDDTWRYIHAGLWNVSFGIKTDGTLWAWGDDALSVKGPISGASAVPEQIGTDDDWLMVESFDSNTYAWKTTGELYVWGYNYFRTLSSVAEETNSYGNFDTISTPLLLGTYGDFDPDDPKRKIWFGPQTGLVIKPDGTLWATGAWSDFSNWPGLGSTPPGLQLGTDTDWDYVGRMGDSFATVAVKTDGRAYAWGQFDDDGNFPPSFKNLELISTETPAQAVNAKKVYGGYQGIYHIIDDQDRLYTLGANYDGALGNGRGGEGPLPSPLGSQFNVELGNSYLVAGNVTWSKVGFNASMHSTEAGRVFVYGNNNFAQLGYNRDLFADISIPAQIYTGNNYDTSDADTKEELWKLAVIDRGGYDPASNTFNEPILTGWVWDKGLGSIQSSANPSVRYPSNTILRDNTVDFDDYDYNEGYLLVEFEYETHLAFSHITQISYLSVSTVTNFNHFLGNVFSNLEEVEVFEAFGDLGASVVDFSLAPSLTFSKTTYFWFYPSAPVTVTNLPAGVCANSNNPSLVGIDIYDTQFDTNSLASFSQVEYIDYALLGNTNLRGENFNTNVEIFSLTVTDMETDLSYWSLLGTKTFTAQFTWGDPNQVLTVDETLYSLEIRDAGFETVQIAKANTWVDSSLDRTGFYDTIRILSDNTIVSVDVDGMSGNSTSIVLTNCSLLETITGMDNFTNLITVSISNCPSINSLAFLDNITSLSDPNSFITPQITIPSSIAANPGFVKISGSSWLAQPAQAGLFSLGNQAVLCDI